jgi:hypothetical protein
MRPFRRGKPIWLCSVGGVLDAPKSYREAAYNAFTTKKTSKNMMNHYQAGARQLAQPIEITKLF